MDTDYNISDLLLIEDNEAVIDLFKVITKKFDLKIHYARNTKEFMDLIKEKHFKYVLCDANLTYAREGFFISQIFVNIKNIRQIQSTILLFSTSTFSEAEVMKFGFDGVVNKNFSTIYAFLMNTFGLKSIKNLTALENNEILYVKA